jgi:hypothetical protein
MRGHQAPTPAAPAATACLGAPSPLPAPAAASQVPASQSQPQRASARPRPSQLPALQPLLHAGAAAEQPASESPVRLDNDSTPYGLQPSAAVPLVRLSSLFGG